VEYFQKMDHRSSPKRSELVRKRRAQQSAFVKPTAPKPGSKRTQATPTRNSPPVLMRGDMMAVPMVTHPGHSRVRHRLEIPSKLPGVLFQLPSLPSFQFGTRIISAPLTVILLLVVYFLWSSPLYRVETPKITGLKYIPKQELNRVLDVIDKPIFAIDIKKSEKELQEAFKELSSVDVQVALPATVTVTVIERQPVLVWKQEGRTTWVDSEGNDLPARGEDPSLVVINANSDPIDISSNTSEPDQFLPKKVVDAIIAIHALAPQGTQLVYDNKHGLGWEDPRGWQVYFGTDLIDIQEKLNIYQAIVTHVSQEASNPF